MQYRMVYVRHPPDRTLHMNRGQRQRRTECKILLRYGRSILFSGLPSVFCKAEVSVAVHLHRAC